MKTQDEDSKAARQQRRTNQVNKGGSNLAKKIWQHGGAAAFCLLIL